jgi:aldose 1-epimerase
MSASRDDTLTLECADARVVIDAARGGRIAGLEVAGLALLVGPEDDPMRWGSYPMAPFAGRVRRGRFRTAGHEYSLATNLPPHAIHGTTFEGPWRRTGDAELESDLGPGWPFPGRARQRFALDADGLDLELSVHADEESAEPFPASIGWHPWFRRRLERGGPAQLVFRAGAMYRRDDEGIPTGERVAPPPGPWDDCFTDLAAPPELTWPGALRLRIESDATCFVVYDEPEHALCVEPQSGPPDALNLEPRIVAPGIPLVLHARFAWWRHEG